MTQRKSGEGVFRQFGRGSCRRAPFGHEHRILDEFSFFRPCGKKFGEPGGFRFFLPEDADFAEVRSKRFRAVFRQCGIQVERVGNARDPPFERGHFFLQRDELGIGEELRPEEMGGSRIREYGRKRSHDRMPVASCPVVRDLRIRRRNASCGVERFRYRHRHYRGNAGDGVFAHDRSRMEMVPSEYVERVRREGHVAENDFLFENPNAEHRQDELQYDANRQKDSRRRKETLEPDSVQAFLRPELAVRLADEHDDGGGMEKRMDPKMGSERLAVYAFFRREFQRADDAVVENVECENPRERQRRKNRRPGQRFCRSGRIVAYEQREGRNRTDPHSEIQPGKEQ